MFEFKNPSTPTLDAGAKIKVVGVGGGGCNAINTMIKAGLSGVEYIVANTDAQALNASLAPVKIQLGALVTKGLGAGANPEVGRKAALEEYEKISEVLAGADMVFITAGMGGGTGTGAAPVIAKLARELGALTVGVVTKPFLFEGKKRFKQAEGGIGTLEEVVDSLITIPNQRLLYLAGENLSLIDTFKKADEVLLNAVRGISDLINNTGHINADFADVCTVMSNKGLALMGTGVATGQGRAIKAATEAISSPLLEDVTIDGATGIIINITGNESLTMHETNEAVTLVMEAADEDAEIIFGTVIDPNMNEDVKVTVIATGLRGTEKKISPATNFYSTKVTPGPVANTQQEVVEEKVFVPSPKQNMPTMPEPKMETVAESKAAPVEPIAEVQIDNAELRPSSKLVQNIKDAASKYEATKVSVPAEPSRIQSNLSPEKKDLYGLSRAKTIAEKLGFINFDEEELDKPAFLRKEDSRQDQKNLE